MACDGQDHIATGLAAFPRPTLARTQQGVFVFSVRNTDVAGGCVVNDITITIFPWGPDGQPNMNAGVVLASGVSLNPGTSTNVFLMSDPSLLNAGVTYGMALAQAEGKIDGRFYFKDAKTVGLVIAS